MQKPKIYFDAHIGADTKNFCPFMSKFMWA